MVLSFFSYLLMISQKHFPPLICFSLLITTNAKAIHNSLDSHLLQQDLHHLTMWSQQWHLGFNPNKYVLVRFTSRPQHLITQDYLINDMPISNQNLYRDLGVILTSNLSWNEHYKHLLSNAYRILSLIQRTFIATHCP